MPRQRESASFGLMACQARLGRVRVRTNAGALAEE